MADLTSRTLILTKGLLFLLLGLATAAILVAESLKWRTLALLVICVWSFCRFYYFAFYVIERYVDADYRFSGIGSFMRYWIAKRRRAD